MVWRWLIDRLEQERGQWALWLPAGFGVGIAGFFALPMDPPLWVGPLTAGVAGLLWRTVRQDGWRALGIAVLIGALGFSAAAWRTERIAAPQLHQRLGPVRIAGDVAAIEPSLSGGKVILERVWIKGLAAASTPHRIRISVHGDAKTLAHLRIGNRVNALAGLRPPPPPVMPGAFDFQRHAFFLGIGAYGFVLGDIHTDGMRQDPGLWAAAARRIASTRHAIVARARTGGPEAAGAVAAALLTGHRGYIPEATLVVMRDAGIAHLLAISGLHIGLVAGIVFGFVRLSIAAVPWAGLRLNGKKTAAALAIPAAFAYAVLAGFTVPTERAFLMTSLMLAGVLIDRRALSLRTLAWAALIILALSPESLIGPGFQMSFAAVTALIAGYAWLSARRRGTGHTRRKGLLSACARYIGGVLLTTVIASAATAPFAVYHFQHLAAFGLIANALAVPLAALWVMPAGVAVLTTLPFGLEAVPLWLMLNGIDMILGTAHWVARLPGAAADVAAPSAWTLLPLVGGGLWLTLWRTGWRLLGLPAVVLGLCGPLLAHAPDILIDGDARIVAVRKEAGDHGQELMASSIRIGKFEAESWQRRLGRTGPPQLWPQNPEVATAGLRCDAVGCSLGRAGQTVAIVLSASGLDDDCHRSDLLIALVPVRIYCRPRWGIIDRFDLWRKGTHAVYLGRDGPLIRSVNGERGRRPWVIGPE